MHAKIFISTVAFLIPLAASARGYLENPQPGAIESGIGIISGWHCTAKEITVSIDGVSLGKAGVGTRRSDTADICGHANTGFSLLYNYSNPAPGPHVISVYADGVLIEQRNFSTTRSGGEPFLVGASKRVEAENFPQVGSTAILDWSQAKQSFVVTDIRSNNHGAPDPESPCGKTELLAGSWRVKYTIISEFTQNYQFQADSLVETADRDIPCTIMGFDSHGNFDVIGAYAPSLGRWLIVDMGFLFNATFDMSFTTSSRMDGTYSQAYSDGTYSHKYAAVATRTDTRSNIEEKSFGSARSTSIEVEEKELADVTVMDSLRAKTGLAITKESIDLSDDNDLEGLLEKLRKLKDTSIY